MLEAWRIPKARDTWRSQPSPPAQLSGPSVQTPNQNACVYFPCPQRRLDFGGPWRRGPSGPGSRGTSPGEVVPSLGRSRYSPEKAQLTGSQERRRSRALGLAPAHYPEPGMAKAGAWAPAGTPAPKGSVRAGAQTPSLCCDPSAWAPPAPLGGAERLGRPRQRPRCQVQRELQSLGVPRATPGNGAAKRGPLERVSGSGLDPLQVPESPGLRRRPYTQHPHGRLPSGGTRGAHEPPLTRSAGRSGRAQRRPAPRNQIPGAQRRAPTSPAPSPAAAPPAAPAAPTALPGTVSTHPPRGGHARRAVRPGSEGDARTHAGAAAVGAPDQPAFRSGEHRRPRPLKGPGSLSHPRPRRRHSHTVGGGGEGGGHSSWVSDPRAPDPVILWRGGPFPPFPPFPPAVPSSSCCFSVGHLSPYRGVCPYVLASAEHPLC